MRVDRSFPQASPCRRSPGGVAHSIAKLATSPVVREQHRLDVFAQFLVAAARFVQSPSARVGSSSLMKRRFRGKAKRMPRMASTMIQGSVCMMGMTLPVIIM